MLEWLLFAALNPAWLSVEACTELDTDHFVELALLETGTPAEGMRARLRCEAEAFVLDVQIDEDRSARRSIPRSEAIGGAPERYLALELAELIDAASGPRPEPAPTEAAPEPAVEPESLPPPRRRGFVVVAGRVEAGGSPVVPAGGASLVLGGRIWDYLSLRAEVIGLGGGRAVGTDAVRTAAVWGSVAALATLDTAPVVLHFGAGSRLGGVWLRGVSRGSPRRGRTHGGLTWSPFVTVGVLRPIGPRLAVLATLDAGWGLRPIRGFSAQDLVLSSGGAWVGMSLGVGSRFGS